jgi:rubrerythrin
MSKPKISAAKLEAVKRLIGAAIKDTLDDIEQYKDLAIVVRNIGYKDWADTIVEMGNDEVRHSHELYEMLSKLGPTLKTPEQSPPEF